jgi:hypothetical protein
MSAANPYESPAEESGIPADPLELPALGYAILGTLAVVLGLGMLLKSDVFIVNPGQMSRWGWRDLGFALVQLGLASMFHHHSPTPPSHPPTRRPRPARSPRVERRAGRRIAHASGFREENT